MPRAVKYYVKKLSSKLKLGGGKKCKIYLNNFKLYSNNSKKKLLKIVEQVTVIQNLFFVYKNNYNCLTSCNNFGLKLLPIIFRINKLKYWKKIFLAFFYH